LSLAIFFLFSCKGVIHSHYGTCERANATTAIAIDATESFAVFVFVLVVSICFIHIIDILEKNIGIAN
jgi:hypothetical protein